MIRQHRQHSQTPDIYQSILENGYCEIENPYVSKKYYKKFYNCFNNLIELIAKDNAFAKTVAEIEQDFLALYSNVFCGAPMGYRDCTQKLTKKDQKIYFQYSSEYYSLIQERYPSILNKFDFFKIFLNHLDYVDKKAKIILNEAINSLDTSVPNLKKSLFSERKELTVIIKILRYVGNEKLCTSPHYDKSGLTLVLDNNDVVNDRLILGSYMDPFDASNLVAPKRQFDKQESTTSSLLFPGACLKKINLPLNPTPHAALPARTPFRYSIIAFCLVPNINTTDVQTTIVDKNEFLNNRYDL